MALSEFITSLISLLASPASLLFLTPSLALLVFCVWNRNKINWLTTWSSFILGALIVYPVGIFQLQTLWFSQSLGFELQSPAIRAFIHTAFSEEGAKFFVIVAICGLLANRPADAVGGGLAVGLGFAAAENLLYAVNAGDLRSLGLSRMVTAVPAHAVFGLVMGSLLARALTSRSRRATFGTAAFFAPALLHGMYNFPLYALAGIGSATAIDMWGYGGMFVVTIFVGVTAALVSADSALRSVPVVAVGKTRNRA